MNNCLCGLPVRLGGSGFTINRKHGVMHYIAHMAQTDCARIKGFTCQMMKPYPARDEDKPRVKMVERWNSDNPSNDAVAP
jgi:hypothetical protein